MHKVTLLCLLCAWPSPGPSGVAALLCEDARVLPARCIASVSGTAHADRGSGWHNRVRSPVGKRKPKRSLEPTDSSSRLPGVPPALRRARSREGQVPQARSLWREV